MEDNIKPALTERQWAAGAVHFFRDRDGNRISARAYYLSAIPSLEPEDRHAIAASALYGEHFGFTREDIKRLLEPDIDHEYGSVTNEWYAWAEHLAARIAALLPPENDAR